MRFIFCLITFLLVQQFSQAQKVYAYYDIKWKETDKQHAAYYRTFKKQKGGIYRIVDHYMTGITQMIMYTDTLDGDASEEKNGLYFYFDSSGNKTSEGRVLHRKRIDTWKYYEKDIIKTVEEQKIINDSERDCVVYSLETSKKIREGKKVNNLQQGLWKYYGYTYPSLNDKALKETAQQLSDWAYRQSKKN